MQNLSREGRLVTNCRVDGVPSAAELESAGAHWLNGSTDDVLGLASDPRVREAFQTALKKVGLHRPVHSRLRDELEEQLGALLGRPAGVVNDLSSALRALPTWRFAVDARSDEMVVDGTRVASPDEAGGVLRQGSLLGLIVEAVHPREGDLAPLPRYAEECDRAHATLVTVDPLGLGALGATGGGACQHLAISSPFSLSLASLGAAVPGCGAVVAGAETLVATLKGQLDPPPAAPMAATLKALEVLKSEPQRRTRMFDVAQMLLDGLGERALDTGPAVTPWIPVWAGDALLAQRWLDALAEVAVAARAYLVPGASRLLLSVSATTSDGQVAQILEALDKTAKKLGVPLAPSSGARVEVARPGSYATAAPCSPRWLSPQRRAPSEPEDPSAPPGGLRDRVFDVVETLTWRATNASGIPIRWTADAVRTWFDRRRR